MKHDPKWIQARDKYIFFPLICKQEETPSPIGKCHWFKHLTHHTCFYKTFKRVIPFETKL
jgi:hypothetical protein